MKTLLVDYIEKIIKKIDHQELLKEILLDENIGNKVVIWKDGGVSTIGNSESFRDGSDVIAEIKTPGLHAMDSSFFTDGFCEWNEEKESYFTDSGRKVGDLYDVVLECIENGDMSCFLNDYLNEIRDQYEEKEKEKILFGKEVVHWKKLEYIPDDSIVIDIKPRDCSK
jgi:sporulation protein YlmC with PRC-barrel domain